MTSAGVRTQVGLEQLMLHPGSGAGQWVLWGDEGTGSQGHGSDVLWQIYCTGQGETDVVCRDLPTAIAVVCVRAAHS